MFDVEQRNINGEFTALLGLDPLLSHLRNKKAGGSHLPALKHLLSGMFVRHAPV